MRILHTSDWHLGKTLEGHSRLDEQEKFLEEFEELVEKHEVDLVIIAGDIYDTGNPPAKAEKLLYKTLKKISNEGKRPILVIAGNHDNPDRIVAVSPLAYEHGVILLGTPKSVAEVGDYAGFKIVDAGEGFVELEKGGERSVIIALPYPSERRLNEVFTESLEEEDRRDGYSERIGSIFSKLSEKYREDTVNIAVSHLFVAGGHESDSERPIQLGGGLAVDLSHLPEKAHYIALGHLHRNQRMGSNTNIFYSGSPIQYSKSELNHSKCAYVADIKPGGKAVVSEVYFKNYKPIEVFKCNSIPEAIDTCRANTGRDIWAYFEIKTDRVMLQSEIKEMKELLPDIIEIKPIFEGQEEEEAAFSDIREKGMTEMFKEFYKKQRGAEITSELLDLFLNITKEEGEDDETN